MTDPRKARDRRRGAVFSAALLALGLAAPSHARAAGEFSAQPLDLASIEVRSAEEETDALLSLTCIHSGMLDIRIGGELGLGKGEHEPVGLALRSGALSTRVDGVSVRSPDYEMTGGAMLLTSIEPDGRAMRILAGGKPIEFKPSAGKPTTIALGSRATAALKAFLDRCSRGDR
jgi:hypothetical protein